MASILVGGRRSDGLVRHLQHALLMSVPAAALREPIPLPPNRIARFYRGGRMLGAFRGLDQPRDDGRPEDWVGSATATWSPPGSDDADRTGISAVQAGGVSTTVADLILEHPEPMVGTPLLDRAGPTPGVLVKLLDAGQRLPVHVHPSRAAARRLLGSAFGKTEAWLILATRSGGPGTVWAGFRDGVEAADVRRLIEADVGQALLDALYVLEVTAGDVILVPGGTPHAIGEGIFLLELQEPTDFSVVAERQGFPIDETDASLRLGWDLAATFFEPGARPVRGIPEPISTNADRLLPAEADAYFRLVRQTVHRAVAPPPFQAAYAVGIVLAGSGSVLGASTELTVATGSCFALPAAAVADARVETDGSIDIAWCLGPDPVALEAR
jgi:mannose-6-phosphate isomerase